MDRRIFHIQEKLASQLDRPWTVAMMAAEVQLTIPHFRRVFRDTVGMAPIAYLCEIRFDRAHALLSDPTNFDQVNEIRISCGFQDESNFTRAFKKRFGVTPSECRIKADAVHQLTS